jgi:sulfoxide reductase heme-binding subunit YedZ
MGRLLRQAWAKPLLFVVLLLPLLWLIAAAALDALGANPAQALVRASGDWTLRMLCLLLLWTPLRVQFALPELARFRRMLGLFVYFYALIHFFSYCWLDMGFEAAAVLKDIPKRPFILFGFTALVLLTPLALTSFNRAIRLLGSNRWKALHRLVYVVAVLAIVHFFWMRAAKNNFSEVVVYGAIVTLLLGWRVRHSWTKVKIRAPGVAPMR